MMTLSPVRTTTDQLADFRATCKGPPSMNLKCVLTSLVYSTSGENIGDTGLIQAYRAWQAQYPKSLKAGNEYLLPGLNFTR